MANIVLTGIISKINESEVKGSFEKRVFHLAEEKDKYPSVWSIETHQSMCNVLDGYSVGDKVECQVDVTGREWNDKAFNTLKCWKITKTEAAKQQPATSNPIDELVDDLPF